MPDSTSSSAAVTPEDRAIRRAEHLLLEAMPSNSLYDDGYYAARVSRGIVLEPYEWEILDYARRNNDPSEVRFCEAGAGWGLLCILLAVAGFDVVALTGEPQYCDAMRTLTKRLALTFPHVADRLRIIEGFFPYALDDDAIGAERRNTLISTNVIHEFTRYSQDTFLAKASRFDHVLLDTLTFAVERDQVERQKLRDFLAVGFEIDGCLWEDRLLLMRPKSSMSSNRSGRPITPRWLVGPSATFGHSGSGNLRDLGGAVRQNGHCWGIRLPSEFAATGDSSEFPRRSPWRLLEDGVLLGPPHSMHADIADVGRGCYSHWNDNFYFSASDNSDPARNRRTYTLTRAVI
jgi:hypothetical protein